MKRILLCLLALIVLTACDEGPRSIFEDPCGNERQGKATRTEDGRLVCHEVRPAPPVDDPGDGDDGDGDDNGNDDEDDDNHGKPCGKCGKRHGKGKGCK